MNDRMLLSVFIQAVAEAKCGDKEARTWLEEHARDYLEALGYEGLADMSLSAWMNSNAVELAAWFGDTGHRCRDCAFLVCNESACACGMCQWTAQGRGVFYARSTVKHDTRGFLRPCIYWEDVDEETS